jgi:hypothetical protein
MNNRLFILVVFVLALLAQQASARNVQYHTTSALEAEASIPIHAASNTVAGNILA